MIIRLVVPGEPQGKGRPRITRHGTYTPEKTKTYESYIQYLFTHTFKSDFEPLQGALRADIVAYYSIPKSASKRKQEAMREGIERPVKKPDADNVLKCVADALNEIAYHDDAQIVEASVKKYYADIPRVEVIIEEL